MASLASYLSEQFRKLGLAVFDPSDCAFEKAVDARYSVSPHSVGFGTFLGWEVGFGDGADRILETLNSDPENAVATALAILDHAGGGHAVKDNVFVATPVEPAPKYEQFVSDLCGEYYYAEQGHFYPRGPQYEQSLDAYYSRLEAAGLDTPRNCERPKERSGELPHPEYARRLANHIVQFRGYVPSRSGVYENDEPAVMEGIYPIVGTDHNLANFLDQPPRVMERLTKLVADPVLRDGLAIYVLASNSD